MMPSRLSRPAAAALLLLPTPLGAQAAAVRVGRFTSEQRCTTYVLNSGSVVAGARSSSAAAIGAGGAIAAQRSSVGVAATWRQDLVRDCEDAFPALRASIERALAAGGVGRGGRYVLSGRLAGLSMDEATTRTDGYDASDETVSVSLEYDLRDAAGSAVAGGLVTKRLRTGGALATGDYQASGYGGAGYARLQQEVALAVARATAFRLSPLRVSGVEGNRVRLNYGSAIVPVGSTVRIEAGMASLRFVVSSATGDSAIAVLEGSGDPARITPGTVATFIEKDDPAGNTPRYDRVDLP